MINYAKALPVDKNNNSLQGLPAPFRPLARITSENGTVSSVVSFTHDTTAIEIAAVGGAAAMRWVTTGDTQASIVTVAGSTSNFDHIISTGTVRRFVIPIESQGLGNSSVVGVNRQEGLYQRVAYKSMGVASVLLSEY